MEGFPLLAALLQSGKKGVKMAQGNSREIETMADTGRGMVT